MPTTSSSGLRYPANSDSTTIAQYFQNLANDADRKVLPPFASIAARNSTIPSPTQGQGCTVAGRPHTYDGSAWRWTRTGFGSGTTDAGGHLIVPHSLGQIPTGVVMTHANGATDLLERVATFNVASWDSSNFVLYAHRSDTSAVLPTQPINFSWIAFV